MFDNYKIQPGEPGDWSLSDNRVRGGGGGGVLINGQGPDSDIGDFRGRVGGGVFGDWKIIEKPQ